MLDVIFTFLCFIFFLLTFAFIMLDSKSYEAEKNSGFEATILSKNSKYSLLFGLLALLFAVINSLFYF